MKTKRTRKGGNLPRLSDARIVAALRKSHGTMASAARLLKCSRDTVWKRVKASPELQAILEECSETVNDLAEDALRKALERGDAWAVCFRLKCKAKDRGYVERSEHTGKDGAPLFKPDLSALSEDELKQLSELMGKMGGGSGGNGPSETA